MAKGDNPMKISLDIDCSAEEARRFLGLPDVEPMQKNLMAEMEKRLTAMVAEMDAESMMRHWMPGNLQESMKGMETLGRMFWGAAGGGGNAGKKDARDKSSKT